MHGSVHLFDSLPQVSEPVRPARVLPAAPTRAEPVVGLIRNPRSHRNHADQPEPTGPFRLLVEAPVRRRELTEVLRRFAEQQIDYLAINGGDGTVRDILTCGASVFGDCWPELILVPGGKTNALAHDLELPSRWTLEDALRMAPGGQRVMRRPLIVAERDAPDTQVQGFVFGAGAFTAAIGLGQSTHRRGIFGTLAVAATTMWTVWQAFAGSAGSVLRRCTAMAVRDAKGAELPHSGFGQPGERHMIFASTLGRFPAGMQPFRDVEGPLRMVMLDHPRPSALIRVPWLFTGRPGPNPERFGYHRFGGERFEIDLGDSFILDGEAFPAGSYTLSLGPKLRFVVP